MKHTKLIGIAFLGLAVVLAGCGRKKSNDQANLSGTGFDSISSTEELAQLPQSSASGSTTPSQQNAVEVLPIETSPVTQSTNSTAQTTSQAVSAANTAAAQTSSASGLTREQQIQTALKNAGLYQGNIDGKLGPKTKKAIQQFQTNNNLKADGKVGPKTWAALQPYLTGQTASSSASVSGAAATTSTAAE